MQEHPRWSRLTCSSRSSQSTERQVATLLETLRELRRQARQFRAGGLGEQQAASRVQQVLVDLGCSDWHLLPDRRWPGARRANLDLLLVGPPGVVLVDAKTWAEPRIGGGSLWRGQLNADEELQKARDAADAVAAVLADGGLAPSAVHPVILLVGRKTPAVHVGGVAVVGDLALQRMLTRLGPRLDAAEVAAVTALLDEQCPPAAKHRAAPTRTITASPAPTRSSHPTDPPRATLDDRAATVPALAIGTDAIAHEGNEESLLDLDGVWTAAVEAAMQEPIEAWMTWLHPAQAQLVTRHYSGPARIRGAAGTGKTVVALHRARHLARRADGRLLVTSYVRTLPDVHRALFTRLAPHLTKRVEFRSLHSWAARLLRARGTKVQIADRGGRRLFDQAWADVGARGPLATLALPPDYWWDEIQYVIKGRGLGTEEEYLALTRVGRRTALRAEQRAELWHVHETYQAELAAAGTQDYADLLANALAAVRAEPISQPYTAVIADEVQDLTCVGLQLLHALVGDAPNGLLLVGDGQQAVYPGGFTLTEAGVSVTGRATVLDRNYRNATEILATALELVDADTYDDLDLAPSSGHRAVTSVRPGGHVLHVQADNAASQREALLSALHWACCDGVRLGDTAILVPDNRRAQEWARALASAGVPAHLLTEYDGTTSEAVKVGTYQRAKGLEFACVFLPDYHLAVPSQDVGEPDEAYRERAALARRRVFVAMTRARDRLWLGAR
jgi:hypothetical protein